MTTTISFQPNSNKTPPFSAIVTLDGSSYTLAAMWNFYRGDWYIQLINQTGQIVLNQPLISSPQGFDILLAPGLFTTSTLVFRESTGQFEINP